MSKFSQSRLDIALGQVIRGNLGNAATALATGGSGLVGPQRESLADRIFGKEVSFAKEAFSVITNPLVMIGVALHLRFPIPKAGRIFEFAEQLTGINRKFIPFINKFETFFDKFKGTEIADTALEIAGQSKRFEVRVNEKLGRAIDGWETASGRAFNQTVDQFRIFARMDGLDQAGNKMWRNFGDSSLGDRLYKPLPFSAADTVLVSDLRQVNKEVFEEVVGAARAAGVKDSAIIRNLNDHGMAAKSLKDINELPNFIAHVQTRGGNDLIQRMQKVVTQTLSDPAAARAAVREAPVLSKSLKVRRNAMIPDLAELKVAEEAGLLTPGALSHLTQLKATTPNLREFSMKTSKVMSVYTHSMSKTFAFETLGLGKRLAQQTVALKAAGTPGSTTMAASLEETFIPLLKGRKSLQEYRRGIEYGGMKLATLQYLEQFDKNSFVGKLSHKMKDLLLTRDKSLDDTIAGHFFHTTLGLNPASAAMNLTQNFSTTATVVGIQPVSEAMLRVSRKFTPFLKTTTTDRAKLAKMIRTEFSEFSKSGIDINPLVAEMANLNREIGRTSGNAGLTRKALDKASDVSMFMFGRSELWNRLVAFEAGLIKATRDGLGEFAGQTGKLARRAFAKQLTEITQFAGDPALGVPEIMANLPKTVRQFLQFPTRFANFVVGSTTFGSKADALKAPIPFLQGRNLGTIGRMALFSGLLSEGSRQFLGTDLSKFTAINAFPTPLGFGAIPGLPIVPPAIAVGLTLAADITQGDFEDTKRNLPLLAPFGGLTLARLGQAGMPGLRKVARFAGRDTADYGSRNPDGTINVFDPRGNLKFQLTPTQIWMRAMGLPVGDVQAEGEFRKQLAAGRENMRGVKRDWMTKWLGNDYPGAKRIADGFEQAFGVPLQVRSSDIKAAQHRRAMTRLQGEINRSPKEVRVQLKQALRLLDSQTMAGLVGLGADPAFFDGVPPLDPTTTAFGQLLGQSAPPTRGASAFGSSVAPQSQSVGLGTLFGTGIGR